jgi:vancomycin resistance protein YoaR
MSTRASSPPRGLATAPRGGPHTSAPLASRAGRHRRRAGRAWAFVLATLTAVAIVAGVDLADRGQVIPGVAVSGARLSGRARAELDSRLRDLSERLSAMPLRFEADGRILSTTPAELGWEPDVGATAEAALARGRRGTPWVRAWDRVRGAIGGIELDWIARWDAAGARAVLGRWRGMVASTPRDASLRVVGGEILAAPPRPGAEIRATAVLDAAAAAVRTGVPPAPAPLPMRRVDPRTDERDLRVAVRRAERILDGSVTVTAGNERFELTPADLGSMLATAVKPASDGARLAVAFSPLAAQRVLAPHVRGVEIPPRDARFDVVRGRVRIEPSADGRVVDPKLAARSLLDIAVSSDRTGSVDVVVAEPELTTREARALGIEDRLSSFTTEYTPGEPRVQNIHLAADLLNGAVVMPDKMFSLNERVGPRTRDRGFVKAPVIYEGDFTEDVGGGTSQLATTTFNAAFFAGYPFVEYQSHSYYIDRYPMGREATVSYPAPDLKFRNDTDTASLIATSYTDSSITVSIYGTADGREITATRPRITRRTGAGFEVVVRRIVRNARGRVVRRDTFETFYKRS